MSSTNVIAPVVIGGGSTSKKDPTGWAGAQSDLIDTTGLGIPGISGMQTYGALLQAIEADATKAVAGGTLWSNFKQIIRQKGSGYSSAALNSPKYVPHDDIALKTLLTSWHNTNSNLTAGKSQPYSAQALMQDGVTNAKNGTPQNSIAHNPLSTQSAATESQQVQDILDNYVAPRAKAMGSSATSAQLEAIAQKAWSDGTYAQPNIIDKEILDNTNVPSTIAQDQTTNPEGGAIGSTADQMKTIAKNYGIPVPQDPNQFASFVKDAVGPGGSIDKFTEYAKAQALNLYPWMKGFLTGGDGSTGTGGTVAGYLQPYTTNIASTLGIPSTSVDWTDPKWQSVVATKGPDGVSVPQTLDQAIQTVKTDPRFGYAQSVNGINDAAQTVQGLKSAMGF